ncbi:MAG: hypothetical protein NUV68_03505 [Caldiserica bacterium]|jgi:hypothetical protein|nr:hypothetical protein [Caldisericota bacterium]MDH7562391.1 hypothetical protein [Caldisericota bacterium]
MARYIIAHDVGTSSAKAVVFVGRDLDEAFVACQVLEKACRAFIEPSFRGGAVPISLLMLG